MSQENKLVQNGYTMESMIWFMNLCEFAPNNCLHPLCKDPYQFTEADF